MKPFPAGILVGVILALLYFLASAFYSSRVVSSSKMMPIPLALIGFMVRLMMIGSIFYGLSKIKEIHFQTALISFVLCFSVCTIWKTARSFRNTGSLIQKPLKR